MLRTHILFCLFASAICVGCNTGKGDVSPDRLAKMSGGELKKVVPVSGKVLVDGTPEKGVNIFLYKQGELAQPVANARTADGGMYCLTTYVSCDGIEPGEYVLGFEFIPKPQKNDKGQDEFKGKYKSPTKSEFKLSVKEGVPQKDVNYELKLK